MFFVCCLRCGDPARVVQGVELAANLGICRNCKELVDGYKIDLHEERTAVSISTPFFFVECVGRRCLTPTPMAGSKMCILSAMGCFLRPFSTLLSSPRRPFWGRGSDRRGDVSVGGADASPVETGDLILT